MTACVGDIGNYCKGTTWLESYAVIVILDCGTIDADKGRPSNIPAISALRGGWNCCSRRREWCRCKRHCSSPSDWAEAIRSTLEVEVADVDARGVVDVEVRRSSIVAKYWQRKPTTQFDRSHLMPLPARA